MGAYFIVGGAAMWRYDFWGMLAVYTALIFTLPRMSWRGAKTRAGKVCAAVLVGLYCLMLAGNFYFGDGFTQRTPSYGPPTRYQQ